MANTKLPSRLLDTSAIPALNVTGDLTVDTTTLKVDSTNNRVGIGIASPTAPLHVVGSDSGIKISSASSDRPHLSLFNGTSEMFRLSANGLYAVIGDSVNAERYMVFRAGKVGIGTNNPSSTLQLNVPTGDGLLITSADIATIKMKNTGGGVTDWGFATTNLAAGDFGIYASNSVGGDPITAGTAKLYFRSNGNVGIGTTDPDGFKTKIHSSAKGLFVQSGTGGYTSLGFTGDGGTTKGSLTSTSGLLYFGSENSGGTGSNGEIRVKPGTGNVMTIDASTNITTFTGEVSATLFNGITAHVATTAPSSPAVGKLWFDTTSGVAAMYVYDGSGWDRMSNKVSATGGTVVTSGDYTYHTFTSSGTFTTLSSGTVELLMVAGGGCGGSSTGGGGGAGGLIYNTSIGVTPQAYTVTVGAGQPAAYKNTGRGSNSVALGLTAIGGGGGGWSEGDQTVGVAYSGGSGGGGQSYYGSPLAGGAGTSGQGTAGGIGGGSYSGGGGGAGGAGAAGSSGSGGNGGAGLAYSTIATATSTGDGTYYAGGGGGTIGGNGGAGGGANNDVAGTANTGGGGGGGWGHSANTIGSGGSGIVIIRYRV